MYPPLPTRIETERLILRPPAIGDALALHQAIHETFAQLSIWMPWAIEPLALQETEEHIARTIAAWEANADFALLGWDKEDGEFVLASGFHPLNMEVPSFHIGYWCRASRQGKGYVSEAVNAIRDAGFATVGAKRIEIRCDDLNMASRAVAERCGFVLEGVFRNDCRDRFGDLRSSRYYALTREDVR